MIIEMTVEQMKEIVENYRCMIEDITFRFESNFMKIAHVDVSHVSMMTSTYWAESFVQYDVEDDVLLTLDLQKMKDMLVGSKNTNVVMEWHSDSGTVDFTIDGMLRKVVPIESPPTPLSLPEINYTAELRLDAQWFENAIKHATDVQDLVTVSTTPHHQFKVSAESSIGDALEIICADCDITPVGVDASQSYSNTHLKPISKRMRLSGGKGSTLGLMFGYGMPIQITFSSPIGEYIYFLAPRMEPDY